MTVSGNFEFFVKFNMQLFSLTNIHVQGK